jgi:hypothetical protein
MLRAEIGFAQRQRAAIELLGLRRAPQLLDGKGEIVEDVGDIGVAGAARLLDDCECTPLQALRFVGAALIAEARRDIAEADGHLGVIRPQHLLDDLERAPVEPFGLRIPPLAHVHLGQVVEIGADGKALGSHRLLLEGNRLAQAGLGNGELALVLGDHGQVVDDRSGHHLSTRQGRLAQRRERPLEQRLCLPVAGLRMADAGQ